ncbi:MAG: sigma-54-dependent Fis family transcriptional regulator [bacterium]|nr:sigma-54-dependent Fis family transcriptional regulator [bacterium]
MLNTDTTQKISLLIIDDDNQMRETVSLFLKPEGFDVFEADCLTAAGKILLKKEFDLILLDLTLPDGNGLDLLKKISRDYRNRIIVLTGTGSIQSAVKAMRDGAFDFMEKPINPDLLLSNLRKASELTSKFKEYNTLKKEISTHSTFDKLIYSSRNMETMVQKAKKLALTGNTILITGETGTGKDLLANCIHNYSRKKDGPFIAVNCASIPENLAESELFGYKKGAFTGADHDYPGKFQLAHQGTIFLDEVGELPMILQGKLLRTLDSGEISPLRGTKPVKVDVRVIAATNKNLEEMIKLKNFREDLFYRIDESKIHVPPLRDRKDDIVPLIEHILKIANIANSKAITDLHYKAKELLINFSWPGNIRELKNVINEISALISGCQIKPEHLPTRILSKPAVDLEELGNMFLKDVEKEHIVKVLKITGFDYEKSYPLLGISRATLYRKIQEYGIKG